MHDGTCRWGNKDERHTHIQCMSRKVQAAICLFLEEIAGIKRHWSTENESTRGKTKTKNKRWPCIFRWLFFNDRGPRAHGIKNSVSQYGWYPRICILYAPRWRWSLRNTTLYLSGEPAIVESPILPLIKQKWKACMVFQKNIFYNQFFFKLLQL